MIARWWPRAFRRRRDIAALCVMSVALSVACLLITIQGRQTTNTRASAVDPKTKNVIAHKAITTTVFWVGEQASGDNGHIANASSAWDGQWQAHYGGIDSPTSRDRYLPSGFTPRQNPFYAALPYDDIDDAGQRKPTAGLCPNINRPKQYSWCKNAWIAIRHGNKIAYAQWEDVGPYQEDDTAYVFGASRPRNQIDTKAGLDVSPAVRDFLGLGDVSHTEWNFVSPSDVPRGPWRQIITVSPGDTID